MFDLDDARSERDRIAKNFEELACDNVTMGAMGEAIALIDELIGMFGELHDESDALKYANNKLCRDIRNLTEELKKRDAGIARQLSVIEFTGEFGWLSQLEEKVKEWKWMVEKATIVMDSKY